MRRQVKLKDVCLDVTVGHVGPMADEYVDDGIPFLRSQNILPFRLDDANLKFINEAFHKRLKKSALSPGDVVVVRTGYPGTACVIPNRLPVANCADLVVIRPSHEIDSHYLCCIFNSEWGKSTVSGSLVGVAQQHFNIGVAKEMEFTLPPIGTQKRIASILSAHDDLIENNTRRIKILEETAQSIFREWFVKMRLPGQEKGRMGKSQSGRLPRGWHIGTLEDAFVLQRGFDLSKAVRVSGNVPVISASGMSGAHDTAMVKGPGVVTGRSGSIGNVMFVWDDFWPLNTTLWIKEFRRSTPAHAYYLLRELDLASFNCGAAVPMLNRNDIKGLPTILPSSGALEAFDRQVMTLFTLKRTLDKQNANLRTTRDFLLPKLISGEIPVDAADDAAAELMEYAQ